MFDFKRLWLCGLTLLPAAVLAQNPDPQTGWFAFSPKNDFRPGAIGLAHWLPRPAGQHGFAQMQADRIVFENGTPVKFWGVNIGDRACYPPAARADSLVNYWAKYGINAVRFHKMTWHQRQGDSSTVMNQFFWERFDYFQTQLRQRGIYYGWSHIYGHRVAPADSSRLLAYSEVRNLKYPWAHLNGTTSSLVNFAPDLQELSIELTVNMLNHRNQATGLRYADDPALAFVELQNEDNIFWSAIGESLKQAPTYRRLLGRQFAAWLARRYPNDAALRAAWGAEHLPAGEGLAAGEVSPAPNHGLFGWEYETALKENRPMRRHILDKIAFLYQTQAEFYARFAKAIRATGYRGLIVGSCWQAGSGPSHFFNLHADYQVGIIDRHNYYGGGGGHTLKPGRFQSAPMLAQPGSGLLSTSLQQVADRPFAFSEWMSLIPNEYTAEAPPLMALYGMGLQGWDASFHFSANWPGFTPGLALPGGNIYNADSPSQIGLYPALARLVYRGEITEGATLATRRVNLDSLAQGRVGFTERVVQGYDVKSIEGEVSPRTLAAGRNVVAFGNQAGSEQSPQLTTLIDETAKIIRSNTGQLAWHYGERPYVTANTPFTKAVVGFAQGRPQAFAEVELELATPFAVVLVTATDQAAPLATARQWLVTVLARSQNTGMAFNPARDTLLAVGRPPLLLEPVDLALKFNRPGRPRITVLDHDGLPTPRQVPVRNGRARLQGQRDQALYYLVEFD
ncbi:MAG: hypothetical protein MUC97_01985 [Bernardetiaceae bacterium]|jgi:hypothetical protein|nr:hypothetical protein [Bernardetiaceae bacterium]